MGGLYLAIVIKMCRQSVLHAEEKDSIEVEEVEENEGNGTVNSRFCLLDHSANYMGKID
jgi:hypothetical protein